MITQLLSVAAVLGALANPTAVPTGAQPEFAPAPYCSDSDPGDLPNGVVCQDDPNITTGETPDPRPSSPPPSGGDGPGGGGPGGGGPGGGSDAQ